MIISITDQITQSPASIIRFSDDRRINWIANSDIKIYTWLRGWGNETTEIILRHINEWAVLLSVLLILVGATQKKFTERIEQQGGRVISMPKDNLPHDGCYLVCIEDEVKRESSKLNHDLVLAYRRRWKIVKPSFIDCGLPRKREFLHFQSML